MKQGVAPVGAVGQQQQLRHCVPVTREGQGSLMAAATHLRVKHGAGGDEDKTISPATSRTWRSIAQRPEPRFRAPVRSHSLMPPGGR